MSTTSRATRRSAPRFAATVYVRTANSHNCQPCCRVQRCRTGRTGEARRQHDQRPGRGMWRGMARQAMMVGRRCTMRSATARGASAAALTLMVVLGGCGTSGTDDAKSASRQPLNSQTSARAVDRGSAPIRPVASGQASAESRGGQSAPVGSGRGGSARAGSGRKGSAPAGSASRTVRSGHVPASGIRVNTAGPQSFQALADAACAASAHSVAGAPPTASSQQGAPGSQPGSQPGYQQTAPSSPDGSHAGGPAAETTAGPGEYAVIQQKIEALSRLRPPASLQASVEQLVGTLRRLQQLYLAEDQTQTPSGGHAPTGRQAPPMPPQAAIAAIEQQAVGAAMTAGVPECGPMRGR